MIGRRCRSARLRALRPAPFRELIEVRRIQE
jgi:hypothetical protein